MSQYVYVLTNEAMPDLVKIGYTNDLKARMRDLYKTGVPLPFDCHYAVIVDDVATAIDVEGKLHSLFHDNRVSKRREFFRVSPERVVIALSIGNFEPYYLNATDLIEAEGDIEKSDIEAVEKEERRRERLNLNKIKIPAGSELVFTRDDSITCTTLPNGKVMYNGAELSLSAAALDVLQNKYGNKTTNANGSIYWMYDGKTLDERRQHMEYEEST